MASETREHDQTMVFAFVNSDKTDYGWCSAVNGLQATKRPETKGQVAL